MVDKNEGWTFEVTRTCPACGGTGKAPETPWGQRGYAQGPGPVECQTCNVPGDPGKIAGRERRKLTLPELRELLKG